MVASGLGQAGRVLGSAHMICRPTSAINVLVDVAVGTVTGVFDPADTFTLVSSDYRKQCQAYFLGDASLLQAGDYLIGLQTWFVCQIEALRPASCILCNRTLSVMAPATASSAGVNSYGGATQATNAILASGWPASVLAKTHIEIDPTRLPSDTKTSFFEILLPSMPGVVLSFGQLLEDEIGQNYIISAAELSVTGWRLLAGILTT